MSLSLRIASKGRFSFVREEDLEQIKISTRPEVTVNTTKYWSSLFEEYLSEKKIKKPI